MMFEHQIIPVVDGSNDLRLSEIIVDVVNTPQAQFPMGVLQSVTAPGPSRQPPRRIN
jgi:hypothetical protein